ncbi:MAG: neurogenic locus notch [Legionella sp.]|uniref:neurogenic locus notch n=1 Tax=Legionella sp. TaxID=459 RepID=UPI0039E6E435
MRLFKPILVASMLNLLLSPSFAAKKYSIGCCNKMGGVSYCDSSAGRLVCNNGFYSTCYCTPHAVMDLQLLRGCCLWRGGVLPPSVASPSGLVVCNDGSVSEECSLQNPPDKIAAW